MNPYVLEIKAVDQSKLSTAGGKGANLGALTKLEGIHVPDGFCVTTEAYNRLIDTLPTVKGLIESLSLLTLSDTKEINQLSGEIRQRIETAVMPDEISETISQVLATYGEQEAYAVRSSATAEDLPTASFAGQQDSYLNIVGIEAVLKHVLKCWASLFTERAVVYRIKQGIDHRQVSLAVVIQKMVLPEVSGVLFTADPVTSNRKVSAINASFGLGEALVSGRVNADWYQVMNGKIIDKTQPEHQNRQALSDEQILQLEQIGRRIEKHFQCPQDIEWCFVNDTFHIVQSRPITTLFPIPEANDADNHVYVSVGHQQMMTDAMKPLGLSFYLMTTPAPMRQAGGRLFVDVTKYLSSPNNREKLLETFGQADPLIKDMLLKTVEREDFIKLTEEETNMPRHVNGNQEMAWDYLAQFENRPTLVPELIQIVQTSLEGLKQAIQTKTGESVFEFIREDFSELKKYLFNPESSAVIMIGMYAYGWLNREMLSWLGEKNVADRLSLSVEHNITSEMGLALLDLADAVRPYPEVIAYFQQVQDEAFLDHLPQLQGGAAVKEAFCRFLDRYGMRCAGEIDITRTRWAEKPSMLVALILSNLKNFEAGASKQKFEQGQVEAKTKEQILLEQLALLPNGTEKSEETKRMIGLLRQFIGYREYPKYGMVSRYFIYKQALLKEAKQLVRAKIIHEKEDIFYLSFDELHEVVRTQTLDYQEITNRKNDYQLYSKLTPPRVMTSDGEIITGSYNREDIPANALIGLPVSSGVVEGRARVILNIEDAVLEEGDILVTTFTDPSWTPLFVSIKGLVTEVGGVMTHGAVIAREYGLTAVVGVKDATKRIKDGQQIRVNGTEGYVEFL